MEKSLKPNPVLKKLGFSEKDRLLIIHTDDVGMCQANLQAYQDLWEFGTITSGSVMVPCPWFPAAAELQRQNPSLDFGVHLVLTSEWDFYRWRPISTLDKGSGLLDAQGFFPRADSEVQEAGDPEAALVELGAQVQRALDFGIDVTHLDTHMGAIAHIKFIPAYLQLIREFRVPPLIPRGDSELYKSLGMDEATANFLAALAAQLEEQGTVLVDYASGLDLAVPEDNINQARKLLGEAPAGITHFIIHPSVDTPEARSISSDWRGRVANYEAFMNKELKGFLKDEGFQLIGYRAIREAMRV
jgi:predicted glycoside hydrolase/deacetylase ChbG (UPF0249 family)